ncbi:MAG: putative Ig domain-containing protein [Nanoarchaeota archaeon]
MEKKNLSIIRKWVIYVLLIVFILLLIIPKEIFEKPSIIGAVLAQVRIIAKNAPTFDFNLTNQTINQTSTFILDVNCSDADGDVITYHNNFTGFEINSSTGLINQTNFNQSFVGNNTINISCSDWLFNASQTFVLTILSANNAPVLSYIGPQIATEGTLFTLDIDATDIEGDNLTFSASTALFTINPATGLINFTPSLSQVGNYTINISVFDGELYDYEVISFRIVRGAFCGDGLCGSSESCSSCPSDCGSCPSAPAPETGAGEAGAGGGAEGGTAGAASALGPGSAPYYRCDEKWECSDWSICGIDGVKTRKCTDINRCNTKQKKPAEISKCEYQPTCNDGIKNGNEESTDCGGNCQPCVVANCFDGIKNQDEEDTDCGGICNPCEIKKFAKLPFIEYTESIKILKKFPWILILLFSSFVALTIAGDRIYVRRISKKQFDEYRKDIRKYMLIRRKLYKFVISLSVIVIIASLYIYLFSDSLENMKKYVWIPATIALLAPLAVSAVIQHYAYYEYRKRTRELRLKRTHKREILQLIDLENNLLAGTESGLSKNLYSLAVHHKFDEYPELYKEINPLYGLLSSLEKKRKKRTELIKIDVEIYNKISGLLENKALIKISKDYPEFTSIFRILSYIKDNINLDNYDSEQDLLDETREISEPSMKSIIMPNPQLIEIYNELVDIYDYFVKKHSELHENNDEVLKIERTFTDKIKDVAKKERIVEIVQKDPDFASMYNNLVDLFDHYIKKQELSTKIRNL